MLLLQLLAADDAALTTTAAADGRMYPLQHMQVYLSAVWTSLYLKLSFKMVSDYPRVGRDQHQDIIHSSRT